MDNNQILEIYNTSKKKSEFLSRLDIDFSHKNGYAIDVILLDLLSFLNISKEDITAQAFRDRYKQRIKDEYYKNPHKCVICENIVPFERKDTYTCCSKCCHIKANKERGKFSDETRQKISTGLYNALLNGNYIPKNQFSKNINKHYKLISECISLGILENYDNVDYVDKPIPIESCKEHICPICGKIYHTRISKSGRLKNTKTCSKECAKIKIKNSVSNKVQERIKNGTHKGWQSRNITSYPEKFWKHVLENNNIQYKFNYHFDKYFLDFYIEINNRKIDLEIDGKQHKYKDRLESDKIRDEFIKYNNIEVYRIDWNEINSEDGKRLMKEKIDNFINFLNR